MSCLVAASFLDDHHAKPKIASDHIAMETKFACSYFVCNRAIGGFITVRPGIDVSM